MVPCHDDGELAADAVASIVEEEPVEVVVVDDGSSDPATERALAALDVRVVRREEAGGPPEARMTGLIATDAPYVFPLDADDLLVPGALGRLADLLDEHADAAFAWGDYEVFGEYDGRYRAPSSWLPWTLTWVNPYPISSIFRRDALQRAGGWRGPGYEDWSLWLRLAELGIDGMAAGEVIYRRRVHGSRRLTADRDRHAALYAVMRERHSGLFERRPELRAQERPAVWKRVVYPVLFGRRSVLPLTLEERMKRTMLRRALRLSR